MFCNINDFHKSCQLSNTCYVLTAVAAISLLQNNSELQYLLSYSQIVLLGYVGIRLFSNPPLLSLSLPRIICFDSRYGASKSRILFGNLISLQFTSEPQLKSKRSDNFAGGNRPNDRKLSVEWKCPPASSLFLCYFANNVPLQLLEFYWSL